MNIKSILGILLSLVGIIGILYSIMLYTSGAEAGTNMRTLIIYGVFGAILLLSGFGLNESVKDEEL